MGQAIGFGLVAGGIPILLGFVVRRLLRHATTVWRVVGWGLFICLVALWASILLPSMQNVHGWQNPTARGICAGWFIGTTIGILTLIHGELRCKRTKNLPGFPVETPARSTTE